jgi:hypothetical protein
MPLSGVELSPDPPSVAGAASPGPESEPPPSLGLLQADTPITKAAKEKETSGIHEEWLGMSTSFGGARIHDERMARAP